MRNTFDDPRVSPCPTTGCWLWMGSVNRNGYGQTSVAASSTHSKTRFAHRVFYERYVATIQPGMPLDHICKVPSCVNPDHLRPVSVRENSVTYSDGPTARNARKDFCPKCGGGYLTRPNGFRYCRPCRNAKRESLRKSKISMGANRSTKDLSLTALLALADGRDG